MFKKNRKPIIETYRGRLQADAEKKFRDDAVKKAKKGYYPIKETWHQGSYGFFQFLLALLLVILVIGLIVFIYMLLVKPQGILTVVYEYKEKEQESLKPSSLDEKTCPDCAERVKVEAKICRFCSHKFDHSWLDDE